MDNFDVKFEETLSAFNVHPSETDNSFNTEGDSVIVIPQGGECKIQSISVNGKEQPIVNKNVDIKVPTKTSDLDNDSDFATTNDIPTKVSDLDNDSKFVNEETLEKAKQELKEYADKNDQVGDENIIESISVNGTPQTITGKNVDIIIPESTGGTIANYVKVSKTINSLTVGDTLFKGDTIEINIDKTQLLTYFLKEPIWTHVYLVNKDTNAGFRFACYVKHIYDKRDSGNVLREKKYVIDIQVYYIDGDTKQFVLENSIPVIVTYTYILGQAIPAPSFPNGVQTTYTFENTVKDLSNLYIHYTNSLKENNAGEGFIGGITARKVSEVQDTLLNVKNGVEAPINNYVKVKNNKIVKIEDNVEKLIPINEETDKKIDELENKVNDANVVNINGFVLNEDNSWISEKQLKEFRPPKDKLNYIAQKENDLYYYTYRDINENVGFVKGNSGFYETTISGKPMYTSSQVSTIREGTPARVDKNVKGLSSVSFDLYMTGLSSTTSQYYPEIAFVVDEKNRVAIEVAFSCYNTTTSKRFEIKINRKDKKQITVANLLYTNDTFNSNIKIEIKNNVLIVYKDGEKFSETSLYVICPELYDFRDLENIYFGLRYDKTPPTWGFSNVVFEKQYWEQGYKIQGDTLYVNLEDNTLYRYVDNSYTKPYPNFISVVSNQKGTIYVESKQTEGLRPINSEDTLELGQTIYVDTGKLSSTAYYEINTNNGQLALADTNNYYDWGISGCGLFGHGDFSPSFIQELTPNSGMVEYVSHLSGKITSLTPNTPFYIYGTTTTSKAVYDEQGETKQLDLSMLSDTTGLLGQGGNPTFEEIIPAQNIELAVGQTFDNQEVVIHLNWSGYDTPEGSITFDTGRVFEWYFATSDPYIKINGTWYYQSQGITEVVITLNGTITNIDSHAYGAGYEIPLTNVITKVTTNGKRVTDLLVRTEYGAFGYTKINNIIDVEKVIHITKYTAENIIGFSMQGYSHFQILSGETSGESGNCQIKGMVASKTDRYCHGAGHTDSTGGYWYELVYLPIAYADSVDVISLDVTGSPLKYFDDGDNGLSVYIRLFNVEEV